MIGHNYFTIKNSSIRNIQLEQFGEFYCDLIIVASLQFNLIIKLRKNQTNSIKLELSYEIIVLEGLLCFVQ
ncbi:hypothetical protein SRABI133_05048 [Peribacillus simplex]|uniref:Uncharacterized protein n=1 Tax=Peribacillus simplex TaxID=1478 RepID=A0A9W4PLD7_9BACI|nr:hypothetical protein SRABI133_05048 [Peribacillus simplex]